MRAWGESRVGDGLEWGFGEGGRDGGEEMVRTAMESNPASVCLMVKFSSSKVLVP